MRFSIVAVSMLASAVVADKTVYATELVTITSCAATVTNCPARSTVTSLTSYPVITSEPTAETTSSVSPETTSVVVPTTSAYTNATTVATVVSSSVPVEVSSTASEVSPEATTSSYSVIAITTCIPTVIYSTVPVAAPSTSVVVSPVPSSIPTPSSGNGTTPVVPTSPAATFTGAASTLQGSFAVAAAGGLAAFLFA